MIKVHMRCGKSGVRDRTFAIVIRAARKGMGEVMKNVAERVKKVVVERLGVDASRVTDAANFSADLAAESLDKIDLVMAFEEEFGCEISDDAAGSILTIGDAVRFIEKQAA
jgi:acyl carrier protein